MGCSAVNSSRLFIALPLPKDIRERCSELQNRGKKHIGSVRWSRPEQFHLTLLFLGEIDFIRQSKIEGVIQSAAMICPSFTIRLSGLGLFPNPRSPRVLWVGIGKEGSLMALQQVLLKEILKLDIPIEDRPFHPHLTLGRIKKRGSAASLRCWLKEEGAVLIGECKMEKIILMESQLGSQGARYFHRLSAYLGKSIV